MASNSGWSWSPADVLKDADPNRANMSISNLVHPPTKSTNTTTTAPPPSGAENASPPTTASTAKKPISAAARAAAPAAVGPRATKLTAASATKKRKSDAMDEATREALFPQALLASIDDDDDDRLARVTDTCNAVRRKIRTWTESGAMGVGEFQEAIGVSSGGYSNFMNRTQAWDGQGCDCYWKAAAFFRKRELLGLPLKRVEATGSAASGRANKKAKTGCSSTADAGEKEAAGAAALLDVSGVHLEGEEDGDVPVFDTCDEIRRKIRAFIAKDGITQAALVRALSTCLPSGRKVSPTSMTRFLGQKGPRKGNTSAPYYAAYVFFEKRRIKDGKEKSKHRVEMEGVHGPEGMDLEHGGNTYYVCLAGSRPYVDKFGKINFP